MSQEQVRKGKEVQGGEHRTNCEKNNEDRRSGNVC